MPPPPRPNRRQGSSPPPKRTGKPGPKKAGGTSQQRDRREPDQGRTKGWGGVARRGARRLDEAKPGTAAAAFRAAAQKAEEERERKRPGPPKDDGDQWIDAGPVRDEASKAVARGGKKPAPVRRQRRKELPEAVGRDVAKAAGPAWAGRVKDRLQEAAKAYEAERYRDARRILEPLLERAPSAIAVRELL